MSSRQEEQSYALHVAMARITLEEADQHTEILPQALFGELFTVHTTVVTKALITMLQSLEKRMTEVEECTHAQPISIPYGKKRGSTVEYCKSNWHVDWVNGAYIGISNEKNEHHELHHNAVKLITPLEYIDDLLNRV